MTLRLLATVLCLTAAGARAATWDEEPPSDPIVSRAGPNRLAQFDPPGKLGVLLPSYGKLPLYEAFRLMTLGRTRIEAEDRRRVGADAPDPIDAWTEARAAVTRDAPRRKLGYERSFGGGVYGGYVNCAPGAFRLAIETLGQLRRRKVPIADLRAFVKGQDAVFEFCTWAPQAPPAGTDGGVEAGEKVEPDTGPAPAPPPPLARSAPAFLRQLREYQIAAARFYAGEHERARSAFEAIARTRSHPLRAWAALAALRARLREASLDLTFQKEYRAVQGLPQPERERRLGAAARVERERTQAALLAIEAGVEEVVRDRDLAAVHPAARALREQAVVMLDPARGFALLTERLGDLEANPYPQDLPSRWQLLADSLDWNRHPELEALRGRLPFLDWIRTIQRCTDNPASPNAGDCAAEHRHALERWSERRAPAWLVAVLMTARQLGAEDGPALEAAQAAAADAPERLTLRYHAARLLLAAGRRDEARALADEALADRAALDESAAGLFLQLRLSLTDELAGLGPYLLRPSSHPALQGRLRLGADGDELLNRTLASRDLVALAAAPDVPPALRQQLLVAAWFRADVAGDGEGALAAARQVERGVPPLAAAARQYLSIADPRARRYAMAITAVRHHVSPVVGWRWQGRASRKTFGEARTEGAAFSNWCSFEPASFAAQRTAERTLPPPRVKPDRTAAREQQALRAAGSWSAYLARLALDPEAGRILDVRAQRAMLALAQAGLASDGPDARCPAPGGDALRQELAKRLQ